MANDPSIRGAEGNFSDCLISSWNEHPLSFHLRRHFSSDAPPALYSSVPEVFERIERVANKDIVGKVGAIYLFDVESMRIVRKMST